MTTRITQRKFRRLKDLHRAKLVMAEACEGCEAEGRGGVLPAAHCAKCRGLYCPTCTARHAAMCDALSGARTDAEVDDILERLDPFKAPVVNADVPNGNACQVTKPQEIS
jgi:hypothetical protein